MQDPIFTTYTAAAAIDKASLALWIVQGFMADTNKGTDIVPRKEWFNDCEKAIIHAA
jgi:hypothetical protein